MLWKQLLILEVVTDIVVAFFLQAFTETIRAELDKFPSDVREDVVILFSAHSLPLKVCSKGRREGGTEGGREGGKGGRREGGKGGRKEGIGYLYSLVPPRPPPNLRVIVPPPRWSTEGTPTHKR